MLHRNSGHSEVDIPYPLVITVLTTDHSQFK
jgi:hypothetical protein